MCCWPEADGSCGVEGQTHQNGDLVTPLFENRSSDWREEEVTATEVHDLKTRALELGDLKDRLEMRVEDIEETVRETPEEEETDDKEQRIDELSAGQEAAFYRVHLDTWYYSTACHCIEAIELRRKDCG